MALKQNTTKALEQALTPERVQATRVIERDGSSKKQQTMNKNKLEKKQDRSEKITNRN